MPYARSNRKKPGRIKRTKTFTGCWTCRSRGVKCDEGKPTCDRCRKGFFLCSGYGQRLVWEDDRDRDQKGLQRRVLLDSSDNYGPPLSDEEIDLTLEAIDAAQNVASYHVGLFGVFQPVRASSGSSEALCVRNASPRTAQESASPASISGAVTHDDFTNAITTPTISENQVAEVNTLSELCHLSESCHLDAVVTKSSPGQIQPGSITPAPDTPLPRCYTALLSREGQEGRQLIYHWLTAFSSLMIPTDDSDNPFKTIYMPLAIEANEQTHPKSGHMALLHAMYAVSAFHQAQLCPAHLPYSAMGTKHHSLSLLYLQKSLLEESDRQRQTVLAAIIALHLIDMITGHSSNWRVHLRGARHWLRSFSGIVWSTSKNASTLYQLFLCIETLGPSKGGMTSSLRSLNKAIPTTKTEVLMPDYSFDSVFGITSSISDYCLDRLYGVTRPIFEVIVHVNQLLQLGIQPTEADLENIELKIRLNNPNFLRFPSSTAALEELTRRHASSFYHACYIYFNHTLRREKPSATQSLVRKALEDLEAIERLESNVRGFGLIWPAFVTACEAEDVDLRHRAIRYFHRGRGMGMETLTSAMKVVQEVWHRMATEGDVYLDWRNVMEDLGIDLILI